MCYAYGLLYMHICLFCKYHQTSSESGQDTLAIILKSCAIGAINPLSPNSDQHQFSPNDIRTLSRD